MGRDKALLPLPGHEQLTFVEYLVALLTSFCSEVILVTRDAEQAADYATRLHIPIVTDSVPQIGPLMGVYSGLQAIHSSHALVTAVDMPFVQPEMVSFLLSQVVDDALLVPKVNNVPQVLFAVYARTLLPVIEERLQAGRRDPRSLLEVAAVHYIEEEQLRLIDPQLRSFVNVNTPAELARY
jgi:molybdopterin-guanine dinucleotide biosynthesis protein A